MKNISQYIIENYLSKKLNVKVNSYDDPLKKYYEKYGEKWDESHDLDSWWKEIENTKNNSNLKFVNTWKIKTDNTIKDDYYIVKVYGGLNGLGNWRNYLHDIENIIDKFKESWIIKLDVDVLDDVWTLYFGCRK